MYLVTGGAGFIGSNIVAALDAAGCDVVIMDRIGRDDYKWRNIAKRRLFDIVAPEDGPSFLEAFRGKLAGSSHMGAISTTTETDVDKIIQSNFRLSVDLWNYCARERVPFVYASSAATYGDGGHGFVDQFDNAYLSALRPLNAYGWSKRSLRPLGPARRRNRICSAAALGGTEILQCLWAQRVSQGSSTLGGGPTACPDSRAWSRPFVQIWTIRPMPTEGRCAISSGLATA